MLSLPAPSAFSAPASAASAATAWWEDPPMPRPSWSTQDLHRIALQTQEFNRLTLPTLQVLQLPAFTSAALLPAGTVNDAANRLTLPTLQALQLPAFTSAALLPAGTVNDAANRLTLPTLQALQLPAFTSAALLPAGTVNDAAGNSHNYSYTWPALPFPRISSMPSSSLSAPTGHPASSMAGYSASLGIPAERTRAAMNRPPTGLKILPPVTSQAPGSSSYSSLGSTPRRARIQKLHRSGTATEQAYQRRSSYASARYVEPRSVEGSSHSSGEDENPETDNDPEYIEENNSSGDADSIENALSATSPVHTANQGKSRGKKRKSSDSGGSTSKSSGQAKIFQCTGFGECNMAFTRSEHLARHIRKHTGEKPFDCRCGRAFSRLDNLRQHSKTVHHDQPNENAKMLEQLASVHTNLSARGY